MFRWPVTTGITVIVVSLAKFSEEARAIVLLIPAITIPKCSRLFKYIFRKSHKKITPKPLMRDKVPEIDRQD